MPSRRPTAKSKRPFATAGMFAVAAALVPGRPIPGRTPPDMTGFRRRVYDWIRRIPPGRVATYGQIAALAGAPRRARMVGQALGALPPGGSGRDIPWHRVINAQGRVSIRGGEEGARRQKRPPRRDGVPPETRQQRLLEAEGVRFTKGKLDLARYRWEPAEDIPLPQMKTRRHSQGTVLASGAGLRARPTVRRAGKDARPTSSASMPARSSTTRKPKRGNGA